VRGPFGRNDILAFSAWLTHYVSDAHVPFHAVLNYDGQLTNQHGIHARFESYMFERYRSQLTISPKAINPIANPRDFVFETVLAAPARARHPRVRLQAIGARDVYDDAYYAAFFKSNRGVMERRLNEAIAATAAMIAGAWRPRAGRGCRSTPRRHPSGADARKLGRVVASWHELSVTTALERRTARGLRHSRGPGSIRVVRRAPHGARVGGAGRPARPASRPLLGLPARRGAAGRGAFRAARRARCDRAG
jgi:hypothetical protein